MCRVHLDVVSIQLLLLCRVEGISKFLIGDTGFNHWGSKVISWNFSQFSKYVLYVYSIVKVLWLLLPSLV